MKEPFLILLAIVILVGLAYDPLQTKPEGVVTNSTYSSVGNNSNYNTAENIKNTQKELDNLKENLDKKIAESKRSPYYNKISVSGISHAYGDETNEYLTLYTNLEENESVKITGWYFKSEVTGYYAMIGKAALLPFPFTNTESDVVLQKGDRAIITKGFSPINISFRTNKCTGYFEENRTFTPGLAYQCPLPKDEKLPQFSNNYDRNDECVAIIENINRCATVNQSFIRDLPDTVLPACKNYMTTQINYNACVANHLSDTDFPGHEYRLFLKKFGPLWRPTHDKINLHDQNGLIVDTISY